MNILFTICGRAGSKGVKGKNARDLLDRPLAWYPLACISLYIKRHTTPSDIVDIAVNTDSDALMEIVDAFPGGLDVIKLRRDATLGGDKVPKVAVILDCLVRARQLTGHDYDMVVDLDITSPLRTVADLRNVIDRKAGRPDADVVLTVAPARRNPYFNMMRRDGDFFCRAITSNFTARQEAPDFYDVNGSIYAYSPKALIEKDQPAFFNDKVDCVPMLDTGVLDIDSEEDYALMQVIAGHLFHNVPEYREIFEATHP